MAFHSKFVYCVRDPPLKHFSKAFNMLSYCKLNSNIEAAILFFSAILEELCLCNGTDQKLDFIVNAAHNVINIGHLWAI